MKKLGNLLITLLFTVNLYAGISVNVSSNSVTKGEAVAFSISSDLKNTTFPIINDIDGNKIVDTRSSSSTTIINGDFSEKVTKTYVFYPTKTFTIPSYEIGADGAKYQTQEIVISVNKPTQTQNSNFSFNIKTNKQKVYVGEQINLDVIFKADNRFKISELAYSPGQINDVITKEISKNWNGVRDSQNVEFSRNFILFPQKAGILKIEEQPIVTSILQNDSFSIFNSVKQVRLFSNPLEIEVLPIPDGVNLVGEYELQLDVDKYQVDENQPSNITITLSGYGNLENFSLELPKIDNVTIFQDKDEIKSEIKDSRLYSEKKIKFALLAQNNFKYPAIIMKYFNPKTQKIEVLTTKAFDIKINKKQSSNIENQLVTTQQKTVEKIVYVEKDSYVKYLFLSIGFILGLLVMIIKSNLSEKKRPKEKKEQLGKTKKELLQHLLQHIGNKEADEMIQKIEDELYKNIKNNLTVKEIKKLLEKLS